ncbi:MAG: ABC transporter ATP-binding protein [Deltaproteobacteria bacterium]|jgi:simple sugar transport system ATP-binding protein|nr:ABC transporter ATP-binding protein [Deltaproteobacteria bacterium]
MGREILNMSRITKIYPNGVMANKDVSLSVEEGEIHALMGENGAGKSTLMKILFGIEAYDEGRITFDGRDLVHAASAAVIKSGIGMVHQHFMLVDSLRVYENIILGLEPVKGPVINAARAIAETRALGERYNLKVDPLARVEDISVGLKQKVELLKVLLRGARLLILDEPTAVLTPQETEELFGQLLLLKKNNHTIIFISHKIREVMKICDRVTVLRAGRNVGALKVAQTCPEEISRLMVGRDVVLKLDKRPRREGPPLLEARGLSLTNRFGKATLKKVDFQLRSGQILGVAGVEGNGQNELAEAIFGLARGAEGQVLVKGRDILGLSIRRIRDLGLSYIPEDRLTLGLAAAGSVWQNLIPDRADSPALKTWGFLSLRKIARHAGELIEAFNILCRGPDQEAGLLSGGNMQKVVVARELSADPDVLIANQPTRGIDVGANEFIWKKIVEMRDAGKAILLVSADLNEILELSDSILVMCEGEAAAYFEDAAAVTEEELGLRMLGYKSKEAAAHGQK